MVTGSNPGAGKVFHREISIKYIVHSFNVVYTIVLHVRDVLYDCTHLYVRSEKIHQGAG